MTSQAMYLRADVIGLLVEANIILPPTWKNLENYTKEMLTECMDAMSELIAFYTPYPPPTSADFNDVPSICWVLDWFTLQGMAFTVLHFFLSLQAPHVHNSQSSTTLICQRVWREKIVDTWPEGHKNAFLARTIQIRFHREGPSSRRLASSFSP